MIEIAFGFIGLVACVLCFLLVRTERERQAAREDLVATRSLLESSRDELEYERERRAGVQRTLDELWDRQGRQFWSDYDKTLKRMPSLQVDSKYLDPETFEVKGGQAATAWERLGVDTWE